MSVAYKKDEKFKRLRDIYNGEEAENLSYAHFPGHPCALFGAAGMFPLFKNSYALVIGPSICLYGAKSNIEMRAITSDPRADNLLLLCLKQEDIIFGTTEKIKESILEIDRNYKPEILFVVTTCVLEIIGEDYDAIIEEMKPLVDAKILVIHTDNFTCEDLTPGIEATYTVLAELMKPCLTKKNTVNLLGLRSPMGRKTELVRLLTKQGIEVKNVIPSHTTLGEIGEAPEAKLNIVLEHHALGLAEEMKEKFGTEYLYCERPFSLESTELWYQRISDALGIDLSKEISRLKASTSLMIAEKRKEFAGKSFLLDFRQGRVFDLVRLMIDLGFDPELLIATYILPEDMADIQYLIELGVDPIVLKSVNNSDLEKILEEIRPNYYIGYGDRKVLAKLDIEARHLIFALYSLGFEGIWEVIRSLERVAAGSDILKYKEQLVMKLEGKKDENAC